MSEVLSQNITPSKYYSLYFVEQYGKELISYWGKLSYRLKWSKAERILIM